MAPTKGRKGRTDIPEMRITDMGGVPPMRPGKGGRGMSFDMGSPYLLPAGLAGSGESIHSMSRAASDTHDPYRPVAMLRSGTESPGLRNNDNASTYSASTGKLSAANEKATLLSNAQRSPQSNPGRIDSMSPHTSKSSDDMPMRNLRSNVNRSMPPSRKSSLGSADAPLSNINERPPPRGALPPPPPPPPEHVATRGPPPRSSSTPRTGRNNSGQQSPPENFIPAMPMMSEPDGYDVPPSAMHVGRMSIDVSNPSQRFPAEQPPPASARMGLRPLPPNMPEDNPEVRANRIRSFYKEYFDDSRPNPAQAHYEEDNDNGYFDGGAIFDPETGGFVVAGARPFAAPVGRRAMTPPPRGAPRISGGADQNRARRLSTQSAGGHQTRGRSNGPAPPMPTPKKRMPPPKALQGLPTPSKMNYDMVISSPIDYAPPTSYRQVQNGSPLHSPMGTPRPYSPSVKSFSPLVSSSTELGFLPQPHVLRKSGTFTGLDFAPPPRFRDPGNADSGSDAGSIRSARSGISARQLDAVRAGAYRVSRIPSEVVTTREDLASQLRPKMNLSTPA